jgi:intraflagellar transport protein 140
MALPPPQEMAEALTPEKGAISAEERTSLLLKIAKAAKQQGQWHLACKKYTQAGDKLRAMKALIKSCDVEKITFFASEPARRILPCAALPQHALFIAATGVGVL